jgi:lysophospholipase L1-like esterase
MALPRPKVLVFGHSFVRRLHRDLTTQFDMRAALNYNLPDVSIKLHGIGGRTVDKLVKYDFGYVQKFQPNIVILEVGTNDLPLMKPETVGSKIDDLVHLLLGVTSIRVIGVCLVSDRASSPEFNAKVRILNQYLTVIFNGMHNVFCWSHKGFTRSSISPFLPDGVHFTRRAQYRLYRSYRGAIVKAIQLL